MRVRSKSVLIVVLLLLVALVMPAAAEEQALGFTVTFGGRDYDAAADQTTFTYIVAGTGVPPDLSHFDLEIPTCPTPLVVVSYSPTSAVSFGVDPTTGIDGIKWDVPLLTTDTRTYSITFEGNVVQGTVLAAVKGGPGFEAVTVPGPSCAEPSIHVSKFLSLDGVTWQQVASAPGPDVDLEIEVSFRFVVTNDGDVPLVDLTLTDDALDASGCDVPDTLLPEAFFECVLGPFPAVEGQHSNTVTATGVFEGETVSATASAFYFGGDRPSLSIEKSVSVDGGDTWDAGAAPGPSVEPGEEVHFRFVVTNDGNVTLTGLTLEDSVYDASGCDVPETLEPDESFECVIGPFEAEEVQHTNTATVSTEFDGELISASDSASYSGEVAEEEPIIIVIEGPVTAININIITIYNINIVLSPDDPNLTLITIGDIIRVEGELVTDEDQLNLLITDTNITIVIVAINIIIVQAPVVVVPGAPAVSGDCANPPPPWAPAHGWRARCDPHYHGYTGRPPGGMGMGR
jgi:hypothetical protein